MVLAYPLLLGIAVSPLLGGRLRCLVATKVRLLGLIYAALALQLAAFPVHAFPWRTSDHVAVALWLGSYALLAAAATANIRLRGMPLIAAGLVANLVAVLANGGHMPVLPATMRAAGYSAVRYNSAAVRAPHLPWLVDRFVAPHWLPRANFYSVGDVLLALGGFVLPIAASGAVDRLRRNSDYVTLKEEALGVDT